jgi:hypothetical protein
MKAPSSDVETSTHPVITTLGKTGFWCHAKRNGHHRHYESFQQTSSVHLSFL